MHTVFPSARARHRRAAAWFNKSVQHNARSRPSSGGSRASEAQSRPPRVADQSTLAKTAFNQSTLMKATEVVLSIVAIVCISIPHKLWSIEVEDGEGRIIPDLVSFQAPSDLIRNPHAPNAPEWQTPDEPDGSIEFSHLTSEIMFGRGETSSARSSSWKALRERIRAPRWVHLGSISDQKVADVMVDGGMVAVCDFKWTIIYNGAVDFTHYLTVVWIPVAEHQFVECRVMADTPLIRDRLRSAVLRIRVNRYWPMPED